MACEKPLKIVNRRYVDMSNVEISRDSRERYGMIWPPDYILDVPCGYCHSCQKSHNNQYRIRLMYEIRDHPPDSCLFLTLTFNDDYEPRFRDDYNKSVRLFLDRLRKKYGKQIRHWFICEFGTKKNRAHYHGILFNCPDALLTDVRTSPLVDGVPGRLVVVNDLWSYGFTFTGYVSDATCGYITKYLTKSLNGRKVRPRVLSSFGIGLGYLKSADAALHKLDKDHPQPFMFLNGFKQAMPRYYYNKVFTQFDRENMTLDRYLNPPDEFYWLSQRYPTEAERDRARASTLSQNLRSTLTPSEKPPTKRRMSSEQRFKQLMQTFETEFD